MALRVLRRAFLILHASGALAVLVLCLGAALESVSYYGTEPFAFTYSRSLAALLCGLFAAAHLYLAASKRLTYPVALVFYPLCLVLGVVAELVARGSAKGWPPGSTTETIHANLVGYFVLVAWVSICAISCYPSLARRRRTHA